jgi:O-antigen ligase
MPPTLALFLWLVLLLVLLWFDPAKEPKSSAASWVPVIWMFILGSRAPSQWLSGRTGQSAAALEEGNPLDRAILSVLILLAISILVSRSFKWGSFFARNLALMMYLSFALISVSWSDFPLVAFKKWIRDLGDYAMILVVLSDPRPLEAVRALLRRLGYLLVPLSILLIKYYPESGKSYDDWTGFASYSGATTSKNMLGIVCLIGGLYFFWDTVVRWSNRKERRTKRIILIDISFMAMTLWLLHTCSSATSTVCLLLGCLVIAAAHSKAFQRKPGFLKVIIPSVLLLYAILAFGFGLSGEMAGAVGRDPTLTGRTKIWEIVLSMHTSPLVGAGYESFWLGPRLIKIWQAGMGFLNESHNGYLEAYLNLGMIGLGLLLVFVFAGYRNICRRLKPFSSFASFTLAFWTVFLLHNFTEADFRSGLMWLVFVLGALALPERAEARVQSVAAFGNVEEAQDHLPVLL